MDPFRPPTRQLRPAHWRALDYALTALLALVYAVAFRELADLRGIPDWAAAVIVAVAVLPAAVRRRWPVTALALVVAGGAAATALSSSPAPALAVAFVMYLVPLRLPPRDARRLLIAALAVLAAALGVFGTVRHGVYGTGGVGHAASLLLEDALLVSAAWAIGYAVRQQRAYTASQQEQAERRAREQLAEARRARSEERLQIARELHDVVAHTMSVIAVQAGVANYVVGTHPEEAARALSSIEQTSRGALREMRALLGVLRADGPGCGPADKDGGAGPAGQATSLVPAPGLADLDMLAGRAAGAGVRVDLEVPGERPVLSPGLDLAAYRVIQEAVTNVIKHAATDSCRVTVACQQDALTVEITDHGRGAGRNGDGSPAAGHGLAGMAERVAMYGGQFRAAPLPEHGFRVTARFPLAGAAT